MQRPVENQDEQDTEAGSLVVFDLRALTTFQEDGPRIQVLSDIGTARVVLFTFKAGQTLKEQKTSSQVLVQVLRGRMVFTTASNTVRLQAGMLAQLEAHILHSVAAQTDAVLLITMTPSPLYHSLGRGSAKDLKPLVTRE